MTKTNSKLALIAIAVWTPIILAVVIPLVGFYLLSGSLVASVLDTILFLFIAKRVPAIINLFRKSQPKTRVINVKIDL